MLDLAPVTPAPLPQGASPELIAAGKDAARRMSVGVELNRQGPFTFVVDTGANRSVVASETAAALALPSAGEEDVHGILGAEQSRVVLVDRLTIGEVTSRRLRLPTLGADSLGVQGLLGVDVFGDRRVVLNFHDDRLEIGPSYDGVSVTRGDRLRGSSSFASDDTSDGVRVPARYRGGQLIIVDADVGGLPVTAFLDSGSQNTVANLALYKQMLEHKPDQVAKLLKVELLSATGQVAPGDLCLLPSLRLGGLKMTGLSAVYADLHTFDIWGLSTRPSILVGVDVLRHFNAVELDFGRRQVTFHTPPGWRRL
ncbi:aspartyl protease family protein [Phenylobacterium montanum]|uniref:Aspartyl protease family protein n=1 Tax=Phenylobacterium montanum TaxID=2823693 RepID=A0A975ITG4_9CAUL|nr:retroviral-like aspartic protease family protein [Caulobacter sp. S6]QUD86763.1 aspartyl protease family protein [Caulobacter sp. S6]